MNVDFEWNYVMNIDVGIKIHIKLLDKQETKWYCDVIVKCQDLYEGKSPL